MTTLAESLNEWLPEGDYDDATVTDHRIFTYNSGSPGVELTFTAPNGEGKSKGSWCLHEKAQWKVARLARDLGFSKEEMKTLDAETDATYQRFRGRKCGITVEQDAKGYTHVADVWPVGRPPAKRPEPAPKLAKKDDDGKAALRM